MATKSSKNRRKFGQKTCAKEGFSYISLKNAVFSKVSYFPFGFNNILKAGEHGVSQVVQHH
jgi:hypothetical protein